MKKIFIYILALGMTTSIFTACVDDFNVGDAFLEKAPGVDVNIDTVFSKAEYTRNFLWTAYGQIYCTYTRGNMMNGAPIDVLSDSYHCYVGWGGPKQSYYTGSLTEDAQDTDNGNYQGKFSYSTKGSDRVSIYETVRKCWQIIENIDRVPDMTETEKSCLRGEAYTIMASRYYDAFRNFGGLCLV
ncbi:MAG: RagB/SusD family nutrient uptake outer membrane protein, partial [Prevotella sp.]|nr:RagB/SusD family nutrient uptake outer membrane protein [Prevotella sp.]